MIYEMLAPHKLSLSAHTMELDRYPLTSRLYESVTHLEIMSGMDEFDPIILCDLPQVTHLCITALGWDAIQDAIDYTRQLSLPRQYVVCIFMLGALFSLDGLTDTWLKEHDPRIVLGCLSIEDVNELPETALLNYFLIRDVSDLEVFTQDWGYFIDKEVDIWEEAERISGLQKSVIDESVNP
jgi:hypothetical protein